MVWLKPEVSAIKAALQRHAPLIAAEPIEFLGEGWSVWAFTAGEYVLRFPKHERAALALQRERAILPVIAQSVSLEIPDVGIEGRIGPHETPFAGHRKVEGALLMEAGVPPHASFGRELGLLLRELHTVPPQSVLELGVPLLEGPDLRKERASDYEDVVRRCFPVISCEAREYAKRIYETYLNDAANFVFEPCLVHGDLDCNTLIDEDGKLAGVIDFGDVRVSNPAQDFWMPLFCLPRLGIESQLAECFEAAEVSAAERQRMQGEIDFIIARFPLLDILHGLDTGEDEFVKGGIHALNASLPPDLACD